MRDWRNGDADRLVELVERSMRVNGYVDIYDLIPRFRRSRVTILKRMKTLELKWLEKPKAAYVPLPPPIKRQAMSADEYLRAKGVDYR